MLTQGRHQSNLLLRLGSGLASLYDISGYFSDVLSYTRLLGLGMASGVIATVINLVASMFWSTPVIGPVVTIVIMVFGHVFNLFIGVIGGYVHVSRLQYIEFLASSSKVEEERFRRLRRSQGMSMLRTHNSKEVRI